ncbi:MAG: hypothetical protein QMC89_03040 [Candidatus Hodarchaeaceae archaeon]|nr:hypothetical protein [Candidatus Hodarchaeaceae archaeon]
MNLKPLKKFALERLPKESSLREVILAESDEITTQDFLAKVDVWLKLAESESRR